MAGAIREKITTLKDVWTICFREIDYPGKNISKKKLKPISNKWVYVFKDSTCKCDEKIFYQKKDRGLKKSEGKWIYKSKYFYKRVGPTNLSKDNAKFLKQTKIKRNHYELRDKSLLHEDLHFYLSSVELGKKAVKLIESNIKKDKENKNRKALQDVFDRNVKASLALEKKRLKRVKKEVEILKKPLTAEELAFKKDMIKSQVIQEDYQGEQINAEVELRMRKDEDSKQRAEQILAEAKLKEITWIFESSLTCARARFDLKHKKKVEKSNWKHIIILRDPLRWSEDLHKYEFLGALKYLILYRDNKQRMYRRYVAHSIAREANKKKLRPYMVSLGLYYKRKNISKHRLKFGWDPVELYGRKYHSRRNRLYYADPKRIVREWYGGRVLHSVTIASNVNSDFIELNKDWEHTIRGANKIDWGAPEKSAVIYIDLDNLRMKALIKHCEMKIDKLRKYTLSKSYTPMDEEFTDSAKTWYEKKWLKFGKNWKWDKNGVIEHNIDRLAIHWVNITDRLYEHPSGTLLCYEWSQKRNSMASTFAHCIQSGQKQPSSRQDPLEFFFDKVIKGGVSPVINITANSLTLAFSVVPSKDGSKLSAPVIGSRQDAYREWLNRRSGSARIKDRLKTQKKQWKSDIKRVNTMYGEDVGENFKRHTFMLTSSIAITDYALVMLKYLNKKAGKGKTETTTKDILDISKGGELCLEILGHYRPQLNVVRLGGVATRYFGIFGAVYGLVVTLDGLKSLTESQKTSAIVKVSIDSVALVGGMIVSSLSSMGVGIAFYAACYIATLIVEYVQELYKYAEWEDAVKNSFLGKNSKKRFTNRELLSSYADWISLYVRFKIELTTIKDHKYWFRLNIIMPKLANKKAILKISWNYNYAYIQKRRLYKFEVHRFNGKKFYAKELPNEYNKKQPDLWREVPYYNKRVLGIDILSFLPKESHAGKHIIKIDYYDPRYGNKQPFKTVTVTEEGVKEIKPEKNRLVLT
jgi:hypothetical protein